jgi:hypothetical protein
MKNGILALVLMMSLNLRADDKKPASKDEMVDRVEILIKDIKELRELFEDEDLKQACSKVGPIMESYKTHLLDSGVRLERDKSRSKKVVNWAYEQLIYFHKLAVVCGLGEGQEYVHPDEVTDELKSVLKSLRKQKRKIKRDDVDSHNSFHYDYKFEVNATKNN